MKETTSEMTAPRFKKLGTKVFNVCKAIDYTISRDDKGYITIYDVSGNSIGRATADQWILAIKEGLRHKFPSC